MTDAPYFHLQSVGLDIVALKLKETYDLTNIIFLTSTIKIWLPFSTNRNQPEHISQQRTPCGLPKIASPGPPKVIFTDYQQKWLGLRGHAMHFKLLKTPRRYNLIRWQSTKKLTQSTSSTYFFVHAVHRCTTYPLPGGHYQNIWVGACGALLRLPYVIFQTLIFPTPFHNSDLTQN